MCSNPARLAITPPYAELHLAWLALLGAMPVAGPDLALRGQDQGLKELRILKKGFSGIAGDALARGGSVAEGSVRAFPGLPVIGEIRDHPVGHIRIVLNVWRTIHHRLSISIALGAAIIAHLLAGGQKYRAGQARPR